MVAGGISSRSRNADVVRLKKEAAAAAADNGSLVLAGGSKQSSIAAPGDIAPTWQGGPWPGPAIEESPLPPLPGYEPDYLLDRGTRELLGQLANTVRWGEEQYGRLDPEMQRVVQTAARVPGYLSGQLLQELDPDLMNDLATVVAEGEEALQGWNDRNIDARIYPPSTADDITTIAPYALILLDAATPGGRRTGTVWDSIRATDDAWPGTVLPRSFELDAGNHRVWVAPNASEHIAERAVANLNRGVSRDLVDIGVQQELRSLHAAVGSIGPTLPAPRQMVTVGGWELMFAAPRQQGQLPALIHALRVQE